MSNNDATVLNPTLQRAKQTLRTALAEACGTDLERADTGELIRIEEVLAIANEAAKEAVSVRRRLASTRPDAEPPVRPGTPSSREITDDRGVQWAVFAVTPTVSTDRPTVREQFRAGWLSFDCGAETRRLVPIPTGWQELPESELRALCARAEVVPHRTASSGGLRRKTDGRAP